MPPLDDAGLAQQAAHSTDAFIELYQRYLPQVYRYQLARTGNVDDAQDLTSKTFMAALEGIAGYRAQGSFPAWLMGIARRKLVDHYRQKKPLLRLEEVAEFPLPDPPPEDALDKKLHLADLVCALQSLAPERAEALRLRFFAGLSASEMGQVMGKSEAAVKMLVHRALQDLKEWFTA